ncbi:E3 SUMO-protein ligase ZBED1-like [Sander vitreus]
MVNAMEPCYPIPTHKHLHSQAVRSDKGTRQGLPGQRGETRAHVKASLASAERQGHTSRPPWPARRDKGTRQSLPGQRGETRAHVKASWPARGTRAHVKASLASGETRAHVRPPGQRETRAHVKASLASAERQGHTSKPPWPARRDKGTRQSLPGQRGETRAHVKASLASAERVALTCDGWTSHTTEAYVTITAHLINEEWELVTYVLQTRDMPESHTGHKLAEHLTKALAEWGITEKDPVIVTDNASNMTIAAEKAAFTLHVKCYAHTLNLAAQRALKITAVARLLGRVRRIVDVFRRSTTANHMLKEKQRLLRLPEHKLMTDVVTRWNSVHDMLERFLEQQAAICAALLSSEVRKTEKDLCTLTESDVTTAEVVVSTLKPMKEATQYMSEEKTPTPSSTD